MGQPYDRVFNFSAGPGVMPVEVLEQAREEIVNWHGAGMSVMEMSHRGKAFMKIAEAAEASFRSLAGVPDSYKVLFLQGGASLQFTMVAMNFLRPEGVADYAVTGSWGQKAVKPGVPGKINRVFDGKETNYDRAPAYSSLKLTPGADYFHFTLNETIQGVDYMADPDFPGTTVVCDMSSNILSRPIDFSKYDLIYAGAQKNCGPAGATIVVVKESLLERVPDGLPPMLDYRVQAENGWMLNTPPCWSVYMCGLVFEHWARNGGLTAAAERNEAKAKAIYDAIDGSGGFFKGHAVKENRSRMNIAFTLANADLTDTFVSEAAANGMVELKGHRSVGGCRASVYNAFPPEGATALAQFMADFAARNG
ncbi:MAG TPA: 3-phosphoserine/phosphohydroxythreonine transaminase [Fimbriimonadaceae bacterium]|nr:3-phosphoserine/phosphohydroxythreonine transaminase [Fimbriimonadaceae bacterium]